MAQATVQAHKPVGFAKWKTSIDERLQLVALYGHWSQILQQIQKKAFHTYYSILLPRMAELRLRTFYGNFCTPYKLQKMVEP